MTERMRRLIAVNAYAGAAYLPIASMPVIVGALVEDLGFSLQQAGLIAFSETVGMSLGATAVSIWSPSIRGRLRQQLLIGLAAIALCQLGSAFTQSLEGLAAFRFFSGLGTGSIFNLATIYIASLERPERPFSAQLGLAYVTAALGLFLVPLILDRGVALGALYLGYGVFIAASMFAIVSYPSRGDAARADDVTAAPSGPNPLMAPIIMVLIAILANFIVSGGLWVYYERIAVANGVDGEGLGAMLSIGSLCAVLGTLAVGLLGDRLGRLTPMTVG